MHELYLHTSLHRCLLLCEPAPERVGKETEKAQARGGVDGVDEGLEGHLAHARHPRHVPCPGCTASLWHHATGSSPVTSATAAEVTPTTNPRTHTSSFLQSPHPPPPCPPGMLLCGRAGVYDVPHTCPTVMLFDGPAPDSVGQGPVLPHLADSQVDGIAVSTGQVVGTAVAVVCVLLGLVREVRAEGGHLQILVDRAECRLHGVCRERAPRMRSPCRPSVVGPGHAWWRAVLYGGGIETGCVCWQACAGEKGWGGDPLEGRT